MPKRDILIYLTKKPLGAAYTAPSTFLGSSLLYAPPQLGSPIPHHAEARSMTGALTLTIPPTNLEPQKYAVRCPRISSAFAALIDSTKACFGIKGLERMNNHYLVRYRATLQSAFLAKWEGKADEDFGQLAGYIAENFVDAGVSGGYKKDREERMDLVERMLGDFLAKMEGDFEFTCLFGGSNGEYYFSRGIEWLRLRGGGGGGGGAHCLGVGSVRSLEDVGVEVGGGGDIAGVQAT